MRILFRYSGYDMYSFFSVVLDKGVVFDCLSIRFLVVWKMKPSDPEPDP